MTAYIGAAFVGLAFIVLLRAFGLIEKAPAVMGISTQALRDLRDPGLDDAAKEVRMRAHARTLAGLFVVLTAGTAVAGAAPMGVVWLLDAGGLVSFDHVLRAVATWPIVVIATIGFAAQLWLARASHGP